MSYTIGRLPNRFVRPPLRQPSADVTEAPHRPTIARVIMVRFPRLHWL
jgi:hypothetical protein